MPMPFKKIFDAKKWEKDERHAVRIGTILNKVGLIQALSRRSFADIISHTSIISGINSCSKSIIWIPDFKYLHFPKLFSLKYKIFK